MIHSSSNLLKHFVPQKTEACKKEYFFIKTRMLFHDMIDRDLALCTLLTYPCLINRFSTWTISAASLIDIFISDIKTIIEYIIKPCHAGIILSRT